MLASGAGVEARQALGSVVFFGVLISVFLTLFLISAVYALLARKTQSPAHIARQVEALQQKTASLPSASGGGI